MKKIILPLFMGLLLIGIGCKSGPSGSDPRSTLLGFFQALSKKDIKEARKFTTKESESMLNMMEMGMQMGEKMKSKEKSDEEFSKFDEQNVEIGEAKIDGDKAIVPIKNKKDGESTNMILKKEDGAWKVAFDKATMAEMAGEKMKERGVSSDAVMDSLSHALQNINTDSLKEVMQKGLGALDSLKDVMKALPK